MYIYTYFTDTRLLIIISLILYLSASLTSILLYRNHKLSNIVSNLISCIASISGLWASLKYLLTATKDTVKISSFTLNIPYFSINMNMDKLSAFFLLILSLLAISISIYSIGYISHYYGKRNVGLFNFLYNLFIVSMICVFTSNSSVFFLISWEVMALVSFFLVVFESEHKENYKAGIIYLIMTHIATSFLVISFALMYKYTGSFEIGPILQTLPPTIKNLIFVFLFIGFGTKSGIIPFHIWLPYAYTAAPSNVSALMSGIMTKTAIYGLIRFILAGMGVTAGWWGILILIAGIASTILGVAYALMEQNIKRLLAYSSIENIGIILIGLGISLFSYSTGNMALCSLSLTASLLHLLNHAVFKSLLFLGAGSIDFSTHTKNMEKLGGLLKRMPYTGLFFLVASLSISALPPFNGFIGEWLTYQALFLNLGVSSNGVKLISIIAVAALAMAGALAAACFVKSFGISFLALPRSEEAKTAKEAGKSMLTGMGILSALCLLLGIFPSIVLKLIDGISFNIFNYSITQDFKGHYSFLFYPINSGKNSISPQLATVLLVFLLALTLAVVKLASRGTSTRKYGTWDCGYIGLNSRMQYSGTGFSKPLRIVFRGLFKPGRELKIEQSSSPYYPKSMEYVVTTQPIFEKYLYLPITEFFTRFARRTRLSVQTGSMHTYLIYIFITIVVMLVYYGLN